MARAFHQKALPFFDVEPKVTSTGELVISFDDGIVASMEVNGVLPELFESNRNLFVAEEEHLEALYELAEWSFLERRPWMTFIRKCMKNRVQRRDICVFYHDLKTWRQSRHAPERPDEATDFSLTKLRDKS
ncbi:MAG: hypothetical protein L0210_14635 [Rhodospirillales bacterium]|nr:hypothetical protein [Rhodospirillales bacterium]